MSGVIFFSTPMNLSACRGLVRRLAQPRNVRDRRRPQRLLSSRTEEDRSVIYEAPLAAPIKSLKKVSVTTAMLSLAIPPAVVFQGSESVPLSGQIAITAVTLLASLGSTSAIHFLFSPYVLSMARVNSTPDESSTTGPPGKSGDQTFEVNTMTLFASEQTSTFKLSEARPTPSSTKRPFVSFIGAGKPLFVHGSVFEDKGLLRKLLGRPLKETEKAKKLDEKK